MRGVKCQNVLNELMTGKTECANNGYDFIIESHISNLSYKFKSPSHETNDAPV